MHGSKFASFFCVGEKIMWCLLMDQGYLGFSMGIRIDLVLVSRPKSTWLKGYGSINLIFCLGGRFWIGFVGVAEDHLIYVSAC